MFDLNIARVVEDYVQIPLTCMACPGYVVEFHCGCRADCQRSPSGISDALCGVSDADDDNAALSDGLLAVTACAAHRQEIDEVYDAMLDRTFDVEDVN